MLESFACATTPANTKIILQGKLYITDRCCYFYTPFNHKTLLGKGSKIRCPYSEIDSIKKETTLVFFANSIRFFFKSGEQILFQSFLSRDACYNFMVSLMNKRQRASENIVPSARLEPKRKIELGTPRSNNELIMTEQKQFK